jgi:hypothetical protein
MQEGRFFLTHIKRALSPTASETVSHAQHQVVGILKVVQAIADMDKSTTGNGDFQG